MDHHRRRRPPRIAPAVAVSRGARVVASIVLVLLAAAAWLAAPRALARPETRRGPALEQLGALARPFRAVLGFTRALALPFLWEAAYEADAAGRVADAVAVARWMAFMLPDSNVVWTVFGWKLAYDFSGSVATADDETERILAGVRWLETGSQVLVDDAEICLTIALVLQDRMGRRDDERSRKLAASWRERTGKDPLELAEGWLHEAARRHPDAVRFWRFALNAEERARAAWRAGDLRGARHLVEIARRDFERDAAAGDDDSSTAAEALAEAVRALDVLLGGAPPESPEGGEALRTLAGSRPYLK
jgi:hypothetical protein